MYRTIPTTSQMPNRSHACRGRPTMMKTHAAVPRIATGQTNGTRKGRGRSGSLYAQHEHADADEREREQRSDVRQIVGLARHRR